MPFKPNWLGLSIWKRKVVLKLSTETGRVHRTVMSFFYLFRWRILLILLLLALFYLFFCKAIISFLETLKPHPPETPIEEDEPNAPHPIEWDAPDLLDSQTETEDSAELSEETERYLAEAEAYERKTQKKKKKRVKHIVDYPGFERRKK
ncbi:hypothetical protein [Candidatus Similichlamydia laticola]|uniref:hypothetical protein n=1 Tax=Candidatus Similichlamydia laticola TaxID=2170265 RepID=UPI000DF74611|nr:hypothetical protein [Candidatus Similichlamydia laticola]